MSGQKPPRLSQVVQGVVSQLLGSRPTRTIREVLDPGRRYKRFGLREVQGLLANLARADTSPVPTAASAVRSPFTGHRLLSVLVAQAG